MDVDLLEAADVLGILPSPDEEGVEGRLLPAIGSSLLLGIAKNGRLRRRNGRSLVATSAFLGGLFSQPPIPVPVKRPYISRRSKFYSFNELSRDNPYKSPLEIDNILDPSFDGLPNIPWSSAGSRFMIFSKSNDGMMKWTVKEIRKFLNTPNPLLCRTRFIRRLKDSQVICNL